MKLKDGYGQTSEREMAALRRVLRGSQTGSMVMDCLHQNLPEGAIIECVRSLYDEPSDTITADVRAVLTALREIGALEED